MPDYPGPVPDVPPKFQLERVARQVRIWRDEAKLDIVCAIAKLDKANEIARLFRLPEETLDPELWLTQARLG